MEVPTWGASSAGRDATVLPILSALPKRQPRSFAPTCYAFRRSRLAFRRLTAVALKINHVWSHDFVEDRTHDGRKYWQSHAMIFGFKMVNKPPTRS